MSVFFKGDEETHQDSYDHPCFLRLNEGILIDEFCEAMPLHVKI